MCGALFDICETVVNRIELGFLRSVYSVGVGEGSTERINELRSCVRRWLSAVGEN